MTASVKPKVKVAYLRQGESFEPHSLRILCVNYEYPPMGGGAGNATRHTAINLHRRGHSVHVLTSRLPKQSDVETEEGMTVYRAYSRRVNLHQAGLTGAATFLPGAFMKLRRLARAHRYDVYHFYFGLPTGLLALYVHWLLKKPYVIALRGSDVPGYDNTRWYLKPLHRLFAPLSRLIWSRAAAVTALSYNLRALAENAVPGIEIKVIGNGIDSELFRQRERRLNQPGLRLLCVCRLVRRKGLEFLLQAMRQLSVSGVTLDIVGMGERGSELHSLIRELGLERAVTSVGYVPRERLPEHYNRADIFVLPSLSESFGQVLLEAMACGLPIIASRVGGVPETVHNELGGLLVQPASSESIIGAVKSLADNPSKRARMGDYNRRLAETQYQWSSIAERYEALYRQCLNRLPDRSRAAGP